MIEFLRKLYLPDTILDYLRTPVLEIQRIVFLDGWTFVHFIFGILLGAFLAFFDFSEDGTFAHLLVIMMLVFFEFFEFVLFQQFLAFPELLVERVIDVIVGYSGFVLFRLLLMSD